MPAHADVADFQVLVPLLFRQKKKVQQVSSHLSCLAFLCH